MGRKAPNPIDVHVGGRLRLKRLSKGVSQEWLGEKLNLTFQQVQKYEQGSNRLSASRLHDIAKALGIKISYFFEGIDGPEDSSSTIFNFDKETIQAAQLYQKVESSETRRIVSLLLDDLGKNRNS